MSAPALSKELLFLALSNASPRAAFVSHSHPVSHLAGPPPLVAPRWPPSSSGGTSVKELREIMGKSSGMRVPYEVRDSPIAGRGLFAVASIPRGALVWQYVLGESVIEHNEASLKERLQGLSQEESVDLLEHIYVWEGLAVEIIDDAKLWNHAANHNTGNHPDEAHGKGDGMSSYARRDIAAGEELTDDYATFGELPWYETLCREHGAQSCLSVGREHR